jgi:hypothetical protein
MEVARGEVRRPGDRREAHVAVEIADHVVYRTVDARHVVRGRILRSFRASSQDLASRDAERVAW